MRQLRRKLTSLPGQWSSVYHNSSQKKKRIVVPALLEMVLLSCPLRGLSCKPSCQECLLWLTRRFQVFSVSSPIYTAVRQAYLALLTWSDLSVATKKEEPMTPSAGPWVLLCRVVSGPRALPPNMQYL